MYNSLSNAHFDLTTNENKLNYVTNAWEPIEVDITKLSRYFSIIMMTVNYKESIYTNFHHRFRKCTKQDFSEGIWDKISYN